MVNLQTITDRVEIEALQAEITDAVVMHDYDSVASLFTEDAAVRIPDAHVELVSRKDIRTGIERMQGGWEFFVQNTHPGAIMLQGDTAAGRAHILEFGRQRDGRSYL